MLTQFDIYFHITKIQVKFKLCISLMSPVIAEEVMLVYRKMGNFRVIQFNAVFRGKS